MIFKKSGLEKIGEGEAKEVFQDPISKDKVLKLSKYESDESESMRRARAKAKFYFHKILHLVFPENFPDVSGAGPGIIRAEKIALDERNKKIKLVAEKRHSNEGEYSHEEYREAFEAERKTEADPRYQTLVIKMRALEIPFDTAEVNFSVDQSGNVKYLDDIDPWRQIGIKEIKLRFKIQKLEEVINKCDAEKREQALLYLNRMEKLREKENEKIRRANNAQNDATTYQ